MDLIAICPSSIVKPRHWRRGDIATNFRFGSADRRLLVAASSSNGAATASVQSKSINSKSPAFAETGDEPRIMFAAGGTGGHVFPAISIALELQKLRPNVQIEFVGTKNRMEWSEVPKAGFIVRSIPAASLKRPLWSPQNFLVPLKLLVSMFASWRVLSRFQPHVVVGTGGYVSGPLCLVAAFRGCPVVLQEQNAYPGITSKLLAPFATMVFVAFAAAVEAFPKQKCFISGNPTRLAMDRYIASSVARRLFFPDMHSGNFESAGNGTGHKLRSEVVLVLGGSLGAKSINDSMVEMVLDMLKWHPQRYVIWQTGKQYYDEVVKLVDKHPRLSIHGFINSMETAYAACDLVVCRAGAITCSEVLASGKPSILIPSPHVTDDHQTKNAKALEQAGAARLLPDDTQPHVLADTIEEILGDVSLQKTMADRALELAVPDAACKIANAVLQLARNRV